ncbi:MAG: nucleotidyltransferase family protein [Prevotella sp.]
MNTHHTLLLILMRLALGNEDTLCDDFLQSADVIELREVMELANRQGVSGLCFEGMQKLPKNCLPEKEIILEWFGQTIQMMPVYERYTKTIESLGKDLNKEGLQPMVMKGFGCSMNYPKPYLRPCGDIDIWLFGKHGDADKYFESIGTVINYDNKHHSVFQYEGFTIENHQTILDAYSHKSNRYMNILLEELAMDAQQSPLENVLIPSVKFNSIHLLRHMASDFVSDRAKLRHIIDWATFVSSHEQEIDWNFVREVAHNANMHRFLDAINGICVNQFGYTMEKFPIEKRDEKLEKKILGDILLCKYRTYYTWNNQSVWTKIGHGWASSKIMWRNRWKHAIVFDEALWDAFVWKVRYKVKNHRRYSGHLTGVNDTLCGGR